jgi:hypothetical protein
MADDKNQEWFEVAEQASREQDPKKLVELTNRLSELLGDGDEEEVA